MWHPFSKNYYKPPASFFRLLQWLQYLQAKTNFGKSSQKLRKPATDKLWKEFTEVEKTNYRYRPNTVKYDSESSISDFRSHKSCGNNSCSDHSLSRICIFPPLSVFVEALSNVETSCDRSTNANLGAEFSVGVLVTESNQINKKSLNKKGLGKGVM